MVAVVEEEAVVVAVAARHLSLPLLAGRRSGERPFALLGERGGRRRVETLELPRVELPVPAEGGRGEE